MVILEKPFASDMLVRLLKEERIAVLKNEMSEKCIPDGNVLADAEFCEEYKKVKKIYSVSENALGWIYDNIKDETFLKSISIVKDKSAFRKICRGIYPDFFFEEVNINGLQNLDTDKIVFPCVIKPAVGFLSKGVFVVRNPEEYKKAVETILNDFSQARTDFPEFVVGTSRFLIEEYIKGNEYAVDAYFNEEGVPAILNIFHHRFIDDSDTSDRMYLTNLGLYEKYEKPFTDFLVNLNATLHLKNFPMHIEFRYDGKKAVPIEINPLRFTGFCLNELQVFISGQHPILSFFRNKSVPKEEMWKGKENFTYSFSVLERPSADTTLKFNEEKFRKDFSGVIDVRHIPNPEAGVAATVFLKTDSTTEHQLDEIMRLDMRKYMI
ncbi:MAG: ATP-grasp domain-containing protein [Bacteroidales bacterium]|nr:ATP-grasp domain-containing protein [Bacteroidales bacterium]